MLAVNHHASTCRIIFPREFLTVTYNTRGIILSFVIVMSFEFDNKHIHLSVINTVDDAVMRGYTT